MGYLWSLWPNIRFLRSIVAEKNATKKCAYMFNVYKNQQSRQTGSRNLTGPKKLPTIWYTYMTLVTKYPISAIHSYWEKCDEKYLGRTEGRKDGRTDGRTDRRTEVKQYTPSPFGEQGYKNKMVATEYLTLILLDNNGCRCCWLCPLNDAKHPGKIVDPASLEQV